MGRRVRTITTHIDKPNPFGEEVLAAPYNFTRPDLLTESLRGARTLYSTYWVRFERGPVTFTSALENTESLFRCAAKAGVERVVHISVTNPSSNSTLPYYRGKALQEAALKESNLPHSILRPTLVFGKGDILINNIAWLIRRFPVFPIFGDGKYTIQPIFVGDLASIAVQQGQSSGEVVLDTAGPERFTFVGLVQLIAEVLSREIAFVRISPALGILLGKLIGLAVRDVLLTRDELDGLMSNKLTTDALPLGQIRFSNWLELNADGIGNAYASELERHFR
jgi:NADH dehydrogenase